MQEFTDLPALNSGNPDAFHTGIYTLVLEYEEGNHPTHRD
jgi:hypothetical protein